MLYTGAQPKPPHSASRKMHKRKPFEPCDVTQKARGGGKGGFAPAANAAHDFATRLGPSPQQPDAPTQDLSAATPKTAAPIKHFRVTSAVGRSHEHALIAHRQDRKRAK